MKEELPHLPLKPTQFAIEMNMSMSRLTRVANIIDPPLSLEGGKIPVNEYPRLYELLLNEPRTLMPEIEVVTSENSNNIG